MEIKKNMVLEYVNDGYIKYFIPKELIGDDWCGLDLDKDFNIVGNHWFLERILKDITNFKLAEKTIDTIYIGDIIKGCNTYTKVVGRSANIINITNSYGQLKDCQKRDECYGTYTIQELKNNDWKVYQEEKEIEELTLEKVCEELGRTIKIIK